VSAQRFVPVMLLLDGYAQAVQRFEQAAKGCDAPPAFLPLFEALNWAVALDERIAAHWAPEGKQLGWGWRDRVEAADVMAGVRFARNRVHHQWSDALRLDDRGFVLPVTLPTGFFEWRWRDLADLPPSKRRDSDGESVYRDRLADSPARLTLTRLRDAFAWVGSLLEPHALREPVEHGEDASG
jgi:hypothetical protein